MVGAMPDESSNNGGTMNGLGTIQARNDAAVKAAYSRAVERGDMAGAARIAEANPDLRLTWGSIRHGPEGNEKIEPFARELHTDATRESEEEWFASLRENDRRRARGAQAMRDMIAALEITRIRAGNKLACTPVECYAAAVLRKYERKLRAAETALQEVVEQLDIVRGLML